MSYLFAPVWVLLLSMPVVSTLSSSQRLSKETLVDVALDLGRPPVLHERKPGDRKVSRRKLKAAELTQEELLGRSGQCFIASFRVTTQRFMPPTTSECKYMWMIFDSFLVQLFAFICQRSVV